MTKTDAVKEAPEAGKNKPIAVGHIICLTKYLRVP
jgi:hypothetical protein